MRHRHNTVRKLPARREARRFTNRPVVSLDAYRSAFRGLQYNPYKRRSVLRLAPFFRNRHYSPGSPGSPGSSGFSRARFVDDEDLNVPVYRSIAQGQVDNRFFHFGFDDSFERSGQSSFLTVSRPPALVPVQVRKTQYVQAPQSPVIEPAGRHAEYLRFSIPGQVMTCIRRRQRREVLLALGKGGGKHKPPKWNDDSYIRC